MLNGPQEAQGGGEHYKVNKEQEACIPPIEKFLFKYVKNHHSKNGGMSKIKDFRT
jgi:hypothetical protein